MATIDQQQMVTNVVEEVLRRMTTAQPVNFTAASTTTSGLGVFTEVDPAVVAATRSQQQLVKAGVKVRDGICNLLKKIAVENANEWGRMELEETKIGRLDHKIQKLEGLVNVPGVEYLQTNAHSGDEGVALDEFAPWGVIGAITPATHSVPTLTCNAINMIAAGNSMVVNPHPSGAKIAALASETYNKAIKQEFGIDPLICIINPPTLRTAEEIFKHEDLPLLVVTGGPAVARAAMKQAKRAIVAGPGNPPVVVDETADLDNAAKSIIFGAAYDNNLLCIGEKEVFVVASVFDAMMDAMRRAGAVELNAQQVQRLTEQAFTWQKDHYAVSKDFVGKDPQVLGQAAGVNVPAGVDLLFGETSEDNPFVPEEQMMPFVPFVRVPDFETALQMAIKHEHGFGHTGIIHSNNLDRITRMGQAMNTTLYAVNGPSTGTLAGGGGGFPSFSIATPSGEGVTSPLTFTRFRRTSIVNTLRMI